MTAPKLTEDALKQALLNARHVVASHEAVPMKLLSAVPNIWTNACPKCQMPFPCLPVTLARALLQRDEEAKASEANYRFMVERAADEKLDGYRNLGARAAAAENESDSLRAEVSRLETERDKAVERERSFGRQNHKTELKLVQALGEVFRLEARVKETERQRDEARDIVERATAASGLTKQDVHGLVSRVESLRARVKEVEAENHNMRVFLKSEHQDRWDSFLLLHGAETAEHFSDAKCPTFYDGCHCSVEVLAHNIKCAEKAEASLASAESRLRLAREALLSDGYFTPEQVGDDIAPRIIERLAAAQARIKEVEEQRDDAEARYTALNNRAVEVHDRDQETIYNEQTRADVAESCLSEMRGALEVELEVHFRSVEEDINGPDIIRCSCGCGWPCEYETRLRAALPSPPADHEEKKGE